MVPRGGRSRPGVQFCGRRVDNSSMHGARSSRGWCAVVATSPYPSRQGAVRGAVSSGGCLIPRGMVPRGGHGRGWCGQRCSLAVTPLVSAHRYGPAVVGTCCARLALSLAVWRRERGGSAAGCRSWLRTRAESHAGARATLLAWRAAGLRRLGQVDGRGDRGGQVSSQASVVETRARVWSFTSAAATAGVRARCYVRDSGHSTQLHRQGVLEEALRLPAVLATEFAAR